jgi:hypothetical protein
VVEVNEALRADPSLANSDPARRRLVLQGRCSDMAEFDQLLDRAPTTRWSRPLSRPLREAAAHADVCHPRPLAELENAVRVQSPATSASDAAPKRRMLKRSAPGRPAPP